ncbi:MAG: hypothetical protein GEV10_29860 [Streptosporangiales bacterium]|nr:hypothetical protein [Streptosporangiales bacterium]
MSPDEDLLDSVATATDRCAYRIWGFGVGPALAGLVRAGSALKRPELVDGAAERVAPALHRDPDPTDHLIPVEALVELRREMDVTPALERFRAAVLDATRPVPGRPCVHRPDLPRWSSTIWVDCMHTDGPGLALLGDTTAAVRVTREAATALQRPDGLFDHGYDVATGEGNGVAWGRGQGWALLGLVGTLLRATDAELAVRLEMLVTALASVEYDGHWHTVVDHAAAPVEMSTSAYVALAVDAAVDAGLVDPSHRAMADRALAAAVDATADGVLPVSDATPVGKAEEYYDRPLGSHPWGQGPLLLALLDRAQELRTEPEVGAATPVGPGRASPRHLPEVSDEAGAWRNRAQELRNEPEVGAATPVGPGRASPRHLPEVSDEAGAWRNRAQELRNRAEREEP